MENIAISKLIPAKDNLFGKYDDEKLQELADSIKINGVLEPLLVCPQGFRGDMEIISGNNRYYAAQLINLSTLPCIIVNPSSDDDKTLMSIEANRHRSINDIPLSRRVIIISRWYSSMLNNGNIVQEQANEKNEENYPSNPPVDSVSGTLRHSGGEDKITLDLSIRSAQRYSRIAKLPSYHLERLDTGEIGIRAAEEIVSLRPDTLSLLDTVMGNNNLVLTQNIAAQLKVADEKGKLLNEDDILAVFTSKKAAPKKVSFTVKPAMIRKYFTVENAKDINSEVDKALTLRRITIPGILAEHSIKTDDIDDLIIEALNSYFSK